MQNKVQLITYADRLSGAGLAALRELLTGELKGLFGTVHILPFFTPYDGADAGFDPRDHTAVDERLGSWDDVKGISGDVEVMADLIVNHISADSPQFEDWGRRGPKSPYHGLFLTLGSVFPEGATEADLVTIYRPRPGLPFTYATLKNGSKHILWTTFTSQQLDIDVEHPQGQAYLTSILDAFEANGVGIIRLDAVGYAIKRPGTSCFMLPETFECISRLTEDARGRGIEVLVEVHSYYRQQIEIARRVDWVYDFALPPLVLHTLYTRSPRHLKEWLAISPRNAVTVLDTHDGIGVIDVGADSTDPVSAAGLLPPEEIDALVEMIHQRSGGQSRQATGAAASNLDLYQVNCTYYDALGRDDRNYLMARAIQFFAPGVPQVYYVGLLGGVNDMELLARTQVGRDINRPYYTRDDVREALHKPIVRDLLRLIRFRNEHPAFSGAFTLQATPDHVLGLRWDNESESAELAIDFEANTFDIRYSEDDVPRSFALFEHVGPGR